MKRFNRSWWVSALVLATTMTTVPVGYGYSHVRRGPTAPNSKKRAGAKHALKVTGPRAMESERATAIQSALIKSGYMTGEPTGHWDAGSEAAMQKMQADNGWQTKITPDSRALIKLGLGPNEGEARPVSGGLTTGAVQAAPTSSAKTSPDL